MELLDRPEYQFQKTHPYLGKSLILPTYGGSSAYGTEEPDLAQIEAFRMEVNESVVRNEI